MRRLKRTMSDQQTPTSYHKFAIDYSCKYAGFTDTSQYIDYICCSHMWYGAFVSCNCCYGVWGTCMFTRHFSKGEQLWCRSVCFPGRLSPSKMALQWQDFLNHCSRTWETQKITGEQICAWKTSNSIPYWDLKNLQPDFRLLKKI